ncbi:hypothetical protein EIP91_008735 [Steccherinum ochraceum]|uniref:Xylanolytic transcriptional activator regulatory domain-containing protein n=1 Tax=Steccherinum ochraceum TaxID=92696 RepID=A0A4R0RPL1_9APHY|nr:hypothetical protein EIP91_008735 [Steccherinum ochraceum]
MRVPMSRGQRNVVLRESEYVENLENRLQKMEELLRKVSPDVDISTELGEQMDKETWYSDRGERGAGPSSTSSPIPPAQAAPTPNPEDLDPSDDELITQREFIRSMKHMDINSSSYRRFFGKSSSVMFVQAAIAAKNEYSGLEMPKTEQGWPILPSIRPQFWGVQPWILGAIQKKEPHFFVFPAQDLFDELIELYFTEINSYLPVLHRPSFEQSMKEGLHERDEGFGSVVLLVCAAAARFSDDPRVLLEGNNTPHSAGWEYFLQVHVLFRTMSLLAPPRLYDIQICAVCIASYLLHASVAHWT